MKFNLRDPLRAQDIRMIHDMYFGTHGKPFIPVEKGHPRIMRTVYPPKEEKKP